MLLFRYGIEHVSREWSGHDVPSWANYGPATGYLPVLATICLQVKSFLVGTIALSCLFTLLDYLSNNFTTRRYIELPCMTLLMGVVLVGQNDKETLEAWIGGGLLLGVLFYLSYAAAFSFDPSLVPLATATAAVLDTLVVQLWPAIKGPNTAEPPPFPGALEGYIGATASILFLGALWWAMQLPLKRKNH